MNQSANNGIGEEMRSLFPAGDIDCKPPPQLIHQYLLNPIKADLTWNRRVYGTLFLLHCELTGHEISSSTLESTTLGFLERLYELLVSFTGAFCLIFHPNNNKSKAAFLAFLQYFFLLYHELVRDVVAANDTEIIDLLRILKEDHSQPLFSNACWSFMLVRFNKRNPQAKVSLKVYNDLPINSWLQERFDLVIRQSKIRNRDFLLKLPCTNDLTEFHIDKDQPISLFRSVNRILYLKTRATVVDVVHQKNLADSFVLDKFLRLFIDEFGLELYPDSDRFSGFTFLKYLMVDYGYVIFDAFISILSTYNLTVSNSFDIVPPPLNVPKRKELLKRLITCSINSESHIENLDELSALYALNSVDSSLIEVMSAIPFIYRPSSHFFLKNPAEHISFIKIDALSLLISHEALSYRTYRALRQSLIEEKLFSPNIQFIQRCILKELHNIFVEPVAKKMKEIQVEFKSQKFPVPSLLVNIWDQATLSEAQDGYFGSEEIIRNYEEGEKTINCPEYLDSSPEAPSGPYPRSSLSLGWTKTLAYSSMPLTYLSSYMLRTKSKLELALNEMDSSLNGLVDATVSTLLFLTSDLETAKQKGVMFSPQFVYNPLSSIFQQHFSMMPPKLKDTFVDIQQSLMLFLGLVRADHAAPEILKKILPFHYLKACLLSIFSDVVEVLNMYKE